MAHVVNLEAAPDMTVKIINPNKELKLVPFSLTDCNGDDLIVEKVLERICFDENINIDDYHNYKLIGSLNSGETIALNNGYLITDYSDFYTNGYFSIIPQHMGDNKVKVRIKFPQAGEFTLVIWNLKDEEGRDLTVKEVKTHQISRQELPNPAFFKMIGTLDGAVTEMSDEKADVDMVETSVVFPGQSEKVDLHLTITDANGDDLSVKEVKKQLLAQQSIAHPDDYIMFGWSATEGTSKLEDDQHITFYMKYLTNKTGYLFFKPTFY